MRNNGLNPFLTVCEQLGYDTLFLSIFFNNF